MARSIVEWLGFVRAVYTRQDGSHLPPAEAIKRADETDAAPVVLPFCDAWTRITTPDGCCHLTRLNDAPCPIGWKCPFIKEQAHG